MERKDYYTEEEMMEILGYKKPTMQKRRSLGLHHPPFKKLGGRIVYPKVEYRKWEQAIPLQVAIAR